MGLQYAKQCGDSDIIHYQQSSGFSFGELPLLTLLIQKKVPHKVVTIHNLKNYWRGNPLLLLHRIYHFADAIIVHSEKQKDQMIREGLPEDKIHVVLHGGQPVILKNLVRTRITYFGSPKKTGFVTLLKALRILRDEGIRITLEVYGIYGKDEEQKAKTEASRNNVEDQITWCGSLSQLEFDEKMQESIFTFAKYSEPVWGSNIITRAMMNGTPVIATTIGSSSEYLGETGMYVPPDDPSALCNVIRSLLENRRLREDLGKMARQRAFQYLSWDTIGEKTIQIYQSVIDK